MPVRCRQKLTEVLDLVTLVGGRVGHGQNSVDLRRRRSDAVLTVDPSAPFTACLEEGALLKVKLEVKLLGPRKDVAEHEDVRSACLGVHQEVVDELLDIRVDQLGRKRLQDGLGEEEARVF